MTAAPRRRWFQYRLRTLFVVVTVLALICGWSARYVRWVNERKLLIQPGVVFAIEGPWVNNQPPSYRWNLLHAERLPFGLRLFGAKSLHGITLSDRWNHTWTDSDLIRYQNAFPEAKVKIEITRGNLSGFQIDAQVPAGNESK